MRLLSRINIGDKWILTITTIMKFGVFGLEGDGTETFLTSNDH